MITSTSNDKIKYLKQLLAKRKQRENDKVFVCEGIKLYGELLRDCPEKIVSVYASESYFNGLSEADKTRLFAGKNFEVVKDSVFDSVAETVTPQGILCVAKQPEYNAEEILSAKGPLRILFLEDLRDPGNMGTILRTSEGAGMDLVIAGGDCVDIFNPKVVRATMGSIFRVPFVMANDTAKLLEMLRKYNVTTYAAYLAGSENFKLVKYDSRAAFLIGNEANGLKKETAEAADHCIRIPMAGKLESLNAAVAAAVIMYNA